MKPNELRIGNYVTQNTRIYTVNTGLDIDTSEILEPILLTSDWLVNTFGFKDKGGGYFQHPDYNFFLYHIEEDQYFECYKQVPANDDTGDFKTLQHVHKLQNLFFELFDEELTNIQSQVDQG
ncbi:hypothetical protein [Pedobacter foliorum]|uniref:hypothetical protein n=1 Tax=Pedobacter foliorum TaxID=2739058 RepID=UPI0015637256|nr:hypothetical protein [Pedobacter foliorum]NRF40134.1 hypothetical protein [Pedobacter foliorum]